MASVFYWLSKIVDPVFELPFLFAIGTFQITFMVDQWGRSAVGTFKELGQISERRIGLFTMLTL